jgi:hypothetical protein
MVVQIKEEVYRLDSAIKGSQILSYNTETMNTEVIRPRKNQKWSGVDATLTERYGVQYKKEISMINSLVASSRRYGLKGCQISLDKNNYTAANKLTRQGVSYVKTRKLLDKMDEDELITLYVGYWDCDKNVGIPSFFIVNPLYAEMWEGVDTSAAMKREQDTIVIRDSVTKEDLPTRSFKGVVALRTDLNKYNKLVAENSVEINGERVLPSYKRVYHDNLHSSGRYYTNNSFQTIEKEHRDDIRINGNITIELDYSAIHPRILYTMEGIKLEKEYSPYFVYGVDKKVSKFCLLTMLYAQDRTKAMGAAWNELRKIGTTWETVESVFTSLEERNKQISHHFYQKDLWKSLQYLDGCIASNVIALCMDRNIITLPYHDSFRVEEDYEEILRGLMFEAWQSVLGNTSNCRVDRK